MYPKSDINKLNRRREYHRRLRFIVRRTEEIPAEYRFAMDLPRLPHDAEAKMPPAWVLNAIRWIGTRGLRIKTPTAAEIEKDPRGALKDAISFYEALQSYVSMPLDGREDDAEIRRLNIKFSKSCRDLVSVDFLTLLRGLEMRVDKSLAPPTPKQLHDYNRRREHIASAVVNEDGEYQLLSNTQAESTFLIWFFWQDLSKKLPGLTAQKLQHWLEKEFGLHTSVKTVEIVYTRLKLAALTKPTPPNSGSR
jgi:hypothetical protein